MSQATLVEFFMTPEQYDAAALEYERSLTLEDIMESEEQADQRLPFLGLQILQDNYPELGIFNELLVQFVFNNKLGQVVPDNMLVLHVDPDKPKRKSYAVEHEQDVPFLVAEYVSDSDPKKDRESGKSYVKYEQQLQVPYYLILDTDQTEPLQLLCHNGASYEPVVANDRGRFAVPELDLEIGFRDRLIRYWHKTELLPIPKEVPGLLAERDRKIHERDRKLDEKEQQLTEAGRQLRDQVALNTKLHEVINLAVQQNRHDVLAQLSGVKTAAAIDRILKSLRPSAESANGAD
ncbi:MAG: hypothetical protein O3A00_13360 [Planctomycetota bacterium]|nr:hypothetical protein [Planctomycetota bacterium]